MASISYLNVTVDCGTQNSSFLDCAICYCPAVHGYSLASVAILFALVGSVANTLVCVTITRSPSLRKRQNYLIINLAVGDLVLTVLALPLYAVYTVGEIERSCIDVISRVKGFSINMSVLVSLLTLCAISIERLVVIVWPFKYRTIITNQRIYIVIVIFWIISITYGIIIATNVHVHSNLAYTIFSLVSLAGMALCYLVIIICYVIIFIKSIRMTHNRRALAPNQRDNTDSRVALTVALIISLFTITWGPFVFHRFFAGGSGSQFGFKLSELLALSSSTFNSIIYFYRTRECRLALRQLVCGSVRVSTASGENYRKGTVNLELSNRPAETR